MDASRSRKADVITYALETAGITDKAQAVMVGDRDLDIIGGHTFGMKAIGVLFGYGDRAEHENAGATYIAEKVEDILPLLN